MKRLRARRGQSGGGSRAALAAVSILTGVALLGVGGPAQSAPAVTDAASPPVTSLGMGTVIDTSKNGRIVLGSVGTTFVIRDVVNGKTLRRLPSSSRYQYGGFASNQLTDNGRYVAYEKVVRTVRKCYKEEGNDVPCDYMAPYVRDRITNKVRPVATTSKGRRLPLPGLGRAESDGGFQLGGISGNGRYVVFTEARGVQPKTVYIKDMKRGKLKKVVVGDLNTYNLSISEDGSWIAGQTVSLATGGARPFLIQDRKHVRFISEELLHGQVTTGGRSIYYYKGRNSAADPWLAYRYDTASGSLAELPYSDPAAWGTSYDQRSMSRHGRYTTWHYAFPAGDTTAPRQHEIGVYDRETGVRHDLSAMLTAAGIPGFAAMPPGTPSYGAYSALLISGDGKVVFAPTDQGMVSIRWMP